MNFYFLYHGKLYETTESQYQVLLQMVASNQPFNLKNFALVRETGKLGVDLGKITREQARKELQRC